MKWTSAGLVIVGVAGSLLFSAPAYGQSQLGTAADFTVLAGSTLTNTGPSVSTGHIGVSPGSAILGFPPGILISPGTFHAADATAAQAQTDLTAAYNALVAMPCDPADQLPPDAGGLTLTPGVHCFTAPGALSGQLTLDLQGNPNATFVIQSPGGFVAASGASVVLINSAGVTCPANVYWQVTGTAMLGVNSSIKGNIVASTSIFTQTNVDVDGRLLARNGAVTLDTNGVTRCDAVPEADVSISATSAPASAPPGGDVTYNIVATNQGPDAAASATMTATVPNGLAFKSLVAPAGWSCTTPATGASGTVSCTIASFASGSAGFTLTATLAADATNVPPVAVGVSSSTLDPDAPDRSDTADDTRLAAPQTPVPTPTPTPSPVGTVTPAPTPVRTPCTSRRTFSLQLKSLRKSLQTGRVVSAQVRTTKGKALRTLRVTRTRVTVDLRGLPKQRLDVRVTVRTRAGKVVRVTRNYGTCAAPKTR